MTKLTFWPQNFVVHLPHYNWVFLFFHYYRSLYYTTWCLWESGIGSASYAMLRCPSSCINFEPNLLAGFRGQGAALANPRLCWGSVDGMRLFVMKEEWLNCAYQKYHEKGDGEWFVTTCLISGMEAPYAIALRTALIRALGLVNCNGERPIEDLEKEWKARWNADAVHQATLDIMEGRSKKGVEIRYTGQKQPDWWKMPIIASVAQSAAAAPQKVQPEAAKPVAVTSVPQQAAAAVPQKVQPAPANPIAKPPVSQMAASPALSSAVYPVRSAAELRAEVQRLRKLLESQPNSVEVLYDHACAARSFAMHADTVSSQRRAQLERARSDFQKVTELDDLHDTAFGDLEQVTQVLAMLSMSGSPSTTGSGNRVPPQPEAGAMTLTTVAGKMVTLGPELGGYDAERSTAKELVQEFDKGINAALPLTGGMGLFPANPEAQPKRPVPAAHKPTVFSPSATGGFQ